MRFNDFVVLLEDVGVNELVFFSCLEVHAVLIAELLLQRLKVLVEKNLLESANDSVEFVVLLVLAYHRYHRSPYPHSQT